MIYSQHKFPFRYKNNNVVDMLFELFSEEIMSYLHRGVSLLAGISRNIQAFVTRVALIVIIFQNTPLQTIESIIMRYKKHNKGLEKIIVSRCDALTDKKVEEVLENFPSLHTVIFNGCHSLLIRPTGALVYLDPFRAITNKIFTPNCWKMFVPCPSLPAIDVCQIQINALRLLSNDGREKFSLFCENESVSREALALIDSHGITRVMHESISFKEKTEEQEVFNVNLNGFSFEFVLRKSNVGIFQTIVVNLE
jgi:hypothetical protein